MEADSPTDANDAPITVQTMEDPVAVGALLERHRHLLKQSRNDATEHRSRMDRLEADMRSALAKQSRDAHFVRSTVEGDASELDRYWDGDTLCIKEVKRGYWNPITRQMDTVSEPGLLTDQVARGAEHLALRQAYATVALAVAAGNRISDAARNNAVKRFVRAFEAMPGRIGQWARATFSTEVAFTRAINGSTGTGAELLVTPTLTAIKRPIDLARVVPGLVPQMTAPGSYFKIPQVTGRCLPRTKGKIGNDPARNLSSTFATSDTTYNLISRYVQALLQDDFVTEASLILPDPIAFISAWLNEGDSLGLEIAILHGDTAATHQDTLSTWDLNGMFTAGDLSGSDSIARAYLGWRAHAVDQSATLSAGGNYTISDHFTALSKFGANVGANPSDIVAVTGLRWIYEQGLNIAEFVTYDKNGPGQTAQTGRIASLAGSPLYVSQTMGKQFDNTSGLATGSNNANAVIHARPAAWAHFVDPGSEIGYDETVARENSRYIGQKSKGLLVHMGLSTDVSAVLTYNT